MDSDAFAVSKTKSDRRPADRHLHPAYRQRGKLRFFSAHATYSRRHGLSCCADIDQKVSLVFIVIIPRMSVISSFTAPWNSSCQTLQGVLHCLPSDHWDTQCKHNGDQGMCAYVWFLICLICNYAMLIYMCIYIFLALGFTLISPPEHRDDIFYGSQYFVNFILLLSYRFVISSCCEFPMEWCGICGCTLTAAGMCEL